ncbi:hypothetical protein [Streptomyces chryseus]
MTTARSGPRANGPAATTEAPAGPDPAPSRPAAAGEGTAGTRPGPREAGPVSARTGGGPEATAAQDFGAAGVVAAGVTAVMAALFGDWGAWSSPFGAGSSWFPMPWGVTTGPPVLLVTIAGVLIARAGAPSFARTWAHTAAGLAAATGLLVLVLEPLGPQTAWDALAEAAHAGLFGVALGWVPALAALAVTGRRPRRRTGLAPYVWFTLVGAVLPLLALTAGLAAASPVHSALCTATECVSPRARLLFTGELSLRLALPAWAAGVAVLALARRAGRVRRLRGGWQVLLATAAGGIAVLLSPGLVFGASV